MRIVNDQLSIETGDAAIIDQVGLRESAAKVNKTFETLVIRGTGTPSATSAKNAYLASTSLSHIIVGQDGRELIQMTEFTRRVGIGFKFETTAIILGMVNPGYLLDEASQKSSFRHVDKFPRDQRIFARGSNDRKAREWPLFPREQLDLLLEVVVALSKHYGLKTIRTHEELNINALEPGPAFPLAGFIERLREEIPQLENKPLLFSETKKSVTLQAGPRKNSAELPNSTFPKGAQVAAVDESDGWSLIEVIAEEDEQLYLKGWVETESIRPQPFTAVVRDNLLETQDGRAFPFLPAAKGNFNSRKDSNKPRYLIMHYTTGTQVQSTLNTFRNPANGLSTHLVIARDGRIFQLVPFNHAAYHTGLSFWEGERNLNSMTIGIELDNAGRLSKVNGKWAARGHIIPADRVKEATHWKENKARTFECFTEEQLEVAFQIAQALVKEFKLTDILGHDEVNLKTRYDPGPLFPLETWRKKIFQRTKPDVELFHTKPATKLYEDFENFEGIRPNLNHPKIGGIKLQDNEPITVVQELKGYSLIRVRRGNRVITGWVSNGSIRHLSKMDKISGQNTDFFEHFANGAPPPTEHGASPLPEKTVLRIQTKDGDMALVVSLGRVGRFPYVEGWVKQDSIVKAE